MTSSPSTLKLDFKNLTPKPATPHIGRIGLVIVSAIAMVSTIASINSPSASTAMVVHYDKVQTEDLIRVAPNSASRYRLPHKAPTLSGLPAVTDFNVKSASTVKRPQIHLAMLAPSPQLRKETGVLSLAESHLVTEAVVQHQPDDLGVEVRKQIMPAITPSQSEPDRKSVKSIAAANTPDPVTSITSTEPLISRFSEASAAISKSPAADSTPGDDIVGIGPKRFVMRAHEQKAVNQKPGKPVAAGSTGDRIELALANPDISVAATSTEIDLPTVVGHRAGSGVESLNKPVAELIDPENAAVDAAEWQVEKVRKKDTLSEIFNRLGLSSKEAFELADRKDAKALTKIRPGQEIVVSVAPASQVSDQKQLEALRLSLNKFDTLVVTRDDEGYSVSTETREPEVEYRTISAEINSSLLGAAKRVDIPSDIVYNLASIFGWQIDFARDIQPGDKFSVIYEQMLLDDEVVGHGQVVAAELIASGKKLQAVRHLDEDNRVTYYSPDGEGIQGSFLRSPIKFAPVTSKFSNRRLHPIHKTWKAHKGVDYGAPMKTPIRATGDGVVKFAGKKRGYGNVIVLNHGRQYSTLYAHMSGFKKGLKNGSRIKQGDVIGYVGMTGWATGPHVHYEFHIAGNNKNPLTVELPRSLPIDQKYRKEFLAEAGKWVNNLERFERISLAENTHK